jgi:hypothetical protein
MKEDFDLKNAAFKDFLKDAFNAFTKHEGTQQ